ncbi:MAG: TolC family protein [Bacteroidales bacterium]|nr:TolC family protein [Bacteroidales bacterium]
MKIKKPKYFVSARNIKAQVFSVALFILWLLFIPFSGNISAQDSLSYRNCIEIGLERNYSLKMIRNTEQIARNNYKFGIMGMMPTLDATGVFSNSVVDSRQKFSTSDSVRIKDNAKSNTINTNIALNWTIFDGFGMFVKYRQLHEVLDMGELTTRLAIEDLMANIGSEYYKYLQQLKRLKTLQYVMDLSKERLRITEEKYRIGYQSKLDFQQAKVEYHTDSSLYLQQVQNLEVSRIQLNRVLALNPDTVMTIDENITIEYDIRYDELLEQVLNNNTSLQIAQQKQILSELDLKLINARLYPVIKLSGGYNFTKSEAQAGIFERNRQTGWNYGATVSYPILDGLEVHRQRKNAKLEIENSRLNLENFEQEVLSDLNEIYLAYQNSIKLVELEKQNLIVAHDNFDIAMERFMLGNLSGIEMREIERMFLDAEDRLLNAQYQAKLAEISLKQISGRMQEYL